MLHGGKAEQSKREAYGGCKWALAHQKLPLRCVSKVQAEILPDHIDTNKAEGAQMLPGNWKVFRPEGQKRETGPDYRQGVPKLWQMPWMADQRCQLNWCTKEGRRKKIIEIFQTILFSGLYCLSEAKEFWFPNYVINKYQSKLDPGCWIFIFHCFFDGIVTWGNINRFVIFR